MRLPLWVRDVLPWISVTLSSISFFWIGFRREQAVIRERYDAADSAWDRAVIVLRFLLPYLIGALGLVLISLFLVLLQPSPITIRSHELLDVQGCQDENPIRIEQTGSNKRMAIKCSKDHFTFSVRGKISEAELEQLRELFGTLQDIPVYAVIVEDDREKEKAFPQGRERGTFNPSGIYRIEGYLGGKKEKGRDDRAKQDERFSIMILIPDQCTNLGSHPYYWRDNLPKYLFLSEPLYVTTTDRPTVSE